MYNVEPANDGRYKIYDDFQYVGTVDGSFDPALNFLVDKDDLQEVNSQLMLAESIKISRKIKDNSYTNASYTDVDTIFTIIKCGGILLLIIALFLGY